MTETSPILPSIRDGEDKSSILANRIRKNYRHLRKMAKRTKTDCFRIYDRDIPAFPLAIDFYAGRYSVQYFGKLDSDEMPEAIANEVNQALYAVLGASSDSIFFRTRSKSKQTRQYEKKGSSGEFFTVLEYGLKFWVNLSDYLDTGLFLDHRETRQIVKKAADGKKLLNLFAYTGSFSVQAASGGAIFTKSVDMSNTYCSWANDNFTLNGFSLSHHPVVRADCLKFLDEEIRSKMRYEVIVIDPPTISRSKKMDQLFDVQQDYKCLILKSIELLTDQGVIFFSTNSRKFRFEEEGFSSCRIQEISAKTVPEDFRDVKIHRCWQLQKI